MRFCPRCHCELADRSFHSEQVGCCPQCEGLHFGVGQLDRIAGRFVRGTPDPVAGQTLACAECGESLTPMEAGASRWQGCQSCGGAWVEARDVRALTGQPGPSVAAPAGPVTGSATPPPTRRAELTPFQDRLPFDRPMVQLVAYPAVALVALAVALARFAEPFVFFVRLWIHELGHALPAWLSGRAALPLPFGFTFWREDSSWVTALCLAFLLVTLAVVSLRERRAFGAIVASALLAAQLVCTVFVPHDTMIEWIVAGGLAGELVLSTLFVIAFYYPMPDRFRWDFWRFLALLPTACAFASSFAMWVRVDQGVEGLPLGSIVGTAGDGTGDVDRLFATYDWTPRGMISFYRALGTLCLLVIGVHYAWFAALALRRRRSA